VKLRVSSPALAKPLLLKRNSNIVFNGFDVSLKNIIGTILIHPLPSFVTSLHPQRQFKIRIFLLMLGFDKKSKEGDLKLFPWKKERKKTPNPNPTVSGMT